MRDILNDGWDLLMVAHPPCTRLCNSGVRWLTAPPKGKAIEQIMHELDEGARLLRSLECTDTEDLRRESHHAPAREGTDSQLPAAGADDSALAVWPRRNQGDMPVAEGASATEADEHRRGANAEGTPAPTVTRPLEGGSRTFQGIAEAMATQWGGHVPEFTDTYQYELAI